jgi:hypothetical protein
MDTDQLQSPGVRDGHESAYAVPEEADIRPLRDHLVLEILPWKPSEILEVVYHGRPLRGRVLRAGPGRYPIRYNGPKGRRTKSWDSKAFRPCDVHEGDIVELGGLELDGYLHKSFRWGSKQVVMCREEDVAGVVE